jgi:adenylate cyclase
VASVRSFMSAVVLAFAPNSAFMIGDRENEMEVADRAVALNRSMARQSLDLQNSGTARGGVRRFEHAIRISPIDPRLHRALAGLGVCFYRVSSF